VSGALYGVISALFGLVDLAVFVAFLIVTLTAIRSRRPDAFLPFTIAASMFLLQTLIGLVGPMSVSRFAALSSSSGSAGYMTIFTILSAFGTIMSAIAWSLMMIGLVKIASPPQEFDPNRPPGG
jgi:uncharacterized membrane protein